MSDRLLVLVTGTGRSGTSTMAGALHHAGLHVPGPHLGADDTNPRGFFESRWSVDWHREIDRAARINDVDGRPDAAERAGAVVTDERRERLRAFLAEATAGHAQTAVKDPRTVWVQSTWRDEAAAAGLDLAWISMLRHPAEVVGSRTTHYAEGRGAAADADRRAYAITTLARWANGVLTSEHGTRGQRRSFVAYADLLDDWRPVLRGLGEELGLVFTPAVDDAHHPVDDFVEPGLRRHHPSWDGVEVPDALRDLAEETWAAVGAEAAAGPDGDEAARQRLDAVREAYARFHADAVAAVRDVVHDGAPDGRTGRRRGGRQDQRADRPGRASVPTATVDTAGGRELAAALGRRVAHRLRPRGPAGDGP